MQKLNNANNNNEDMEAERNQLKEKYKQIISSYILKQKQKDLVKNKKIKKNKRTKKKIKNEESSPIKNSEEKSFQKQKKQEQIIKNFVSYSDDEDSDDNSNESESDEVIKSGNDSYEKLNKKKVE